MSVGAKFAAAGVAIVLLVALAWTMLTHHLAQSRQTTSPVATSPVTSITLPEETAALPATPAGELVTAQCSACHSVGMITQQPKLDADKWKATVTKMREAYHAPLAPADDAALVAALVTLQSGGR